MARVCSFCGKLYPEKRIACPHCGADADLTYSDDSYDPDLGYHDRDHMDDEAYRSFLEREGLVERPERKVVRPRRTGCSLLLAGLGLALCGTLFLWLRILAE